MLNNKQPIKTFYGILEDKCLETKKRKGEGAPECGEEAMDCSIILYLLFFSLLL